MTAMSFLLEPNEHFHSLLSTVLSANRLQMEVERCEGFVSNTALVTYPLLAVYILE